MIRILIPYKNGIRRGGVGYSKVRYRRLAKNSNRLHVLAAFSNLLMGEKYMLA